MEGLNLSPVGLFVEAGLVGKFVMGVLFIASLWCWVLIVEGVISVVRLRRALRAVRAGAEIAKPLAGIAVAGDEEVHRRIPGELVSELRARIADAMARAARELLTRSEGGLPNLAVIASVAPFVGLFGTVWGIMTSFAAISQAQDTSLATVAPGIGSYSPRRPTAWRRQSPPPSATTASARPTPASVRRWRPGSRSARFRSFRVRRR